MSVLAILAVLVSVVGGAIAAYFLLWKPQQEKAPAENSREAPVPEPKKKHRPAKKTPSLTKNPAGKSGKNAATVFAHPMLVRHFSGHNDIITDFCVSRKAAKIVTASADGSAKLWDDPLHAGAKFIPIKVDYMSAKGAARYPDQAVRAGISEHGNTALLVLEQSQKLKTYVLDGTKMVSGFEVPHEHRGDVLFAYVLGNNRGILTFCNKLELKLWNARGEKICALNTHQVKINDLRVSDDGRFIASAGFTSEVQIYEVQTVKGTNTTTGCRKVMDLRGHKAAVHSVCFSSDVTRMASVSRDGHLKVWNIDVRYHVGEDPRELLSVKPEGPARLDMIRMSPDGKLLAISEGSAVWFLNTGGETIESIDHTTPQKSPSGGGYGRIMRMEFVGPSTLATLCEVDKQVRLWSAPKLG